MQLVPLVLLAFVPAFSTSFAQDNGTASSPAAQVQADRGRFKSKYHAVQVDEFEVKQGVEFPPEYLKKTQQEILKQLATTKVFDEILQAGQQPAQAGAPVIRLSGTIHNYTPGSRAKRYIAGFGPGAAEVDARVAFLDAVTGQPLRIEELRAVFTGGVFGGSEDKIADELARRVVLQTRFMLDRKLASAESGTTMSNSAPPSPSTDRHTLTMNTKNWSESEQKLGQEALAGYRVVNFSLTGKSTADVELEKVATPPDVYQYRWVHIRLFTHLQNEVSKATAEGFHAFPQTLTGLGPYLSVLMEKPPGASTIQYQYVVTEPMSMSNAQKDTDTHQREGYTLLDETEFGAHILLFEKTSEEMTK
jgi:Domain of unknown function (DUF4410)